MSHGSSWLNRLMGALAVVLAGALITNYVAGLLAESFGVLLTLLVLLFLYRLLFGRK